MNTPTYCGQTTIPVPCSDGVIYQNTNPNFYRFNCYAAGTLGFTIVPDDATSNYSWQLYDVTSTNPVDIFTNPNLFVACNWSSEPGETGASQDGTSTTVCSGGGQPLFSKMPDLVTGHTYMLMVCNQSASPSGYQLSFGGGNAVITDAIDPHLLVADISCDRTKINLRLNKQVKCNTLATDGSDFTVSGGATVIAASPYDCTTAFGTGIVTLTLNQPLGFGNFTLTMADGSDGNSLIDICSRSIPVGETISFISAPIQPTPMDSVFNVVCSPSYIELVFKRPMRCSSIAADGSDFIITGPQTVTGIPFLPQCTTNSSTYIIRLNLSSAVVAGTYQVRLTTGSDGNTIVNECGVATAAGSTVSFNSLDAVSAIFNKSNSTTCSERIVSFLHNGNNNVNSWNWDFGNGTNSSVANPTVSFIPGQYNVKLTVSNGICTNTFSQLVKISDEFKAAFEAPLFICPGDTLHLTNKSNGNIDTWRWSFGNGATSFLETPIGHRYADNGRETLYTIRLIASNSVLGCSDTATHVVRSLNNCYIAVPTAFTPNGDGKNDYLYPLNALKANKLEFKVYNRVGQLVFATKDWTRKWDGTINGLPQHTGVYAWFLSFVHQDSGEKIFMKGTTLLIR
jgi:gliding motility-associated-like protein